MKEFDLYPVQVSAYTKLESLQAHEVWGANCGPHAIAAACHVSLQEVREVIKDFKGWMSPSMVEVALGKLQIRHRRQVGLRSPDLCEGINRIQYEGPWLDPGRPPQAAYAHTHWVACWRSRAGMRVLCTVLDAGNWHPEFYWREHTLRERPFHVTHHYAFRV